MKVKIDNKKINMLSIIGQRAALGTCLFENENNFDNLIVLSADTSTSAGLDKFRKLKSEKYLEMGISEQNMISVAAGLSNENFNVLTTTFSPFQTLRCLEQIKINLGYMKFKVTMVGLASGVSLGTLGYTHCSVEDISVINSIPNINIISPADGLETYKAVLACLECKVSSYIRLTGSAPNPKVYKEDYDFEIGKSKLIKHFEGDFCIISTGSMVSISLLGAEILYNEGVKCDLYNFHTIRPLDKINLKKIFEKYKKVFVVEEHNTNNGLGSIIVNEMIEQKKFVEIHKIGLPHNYDKSGEYNDILDYYELNPNGLARKIKNLIK
tara:strand:- start:5746 stop:6720 length:975 start_codon:yes stop_codon:yes gene_type:complete